MIQFACPSCQKRYRVADDMAGKKARCQQCQQLMQIPTPVGAAGPFPTPVIPKPASPTQPSQRPAVQQPVSRQPVAPAVQPTRPQAPVAAPVQHQPPSRGVSPAADPLRANLTGATPDLRFEISQRPDFAIVSVTLAQGRKIFAEPSAMVSMTPSVKLEAGFKGGLGKTFGRMLGGESLIINTFTAESGPGEILFAGGAAGDIAYRRLNNQTMFLQRGAFMLHTEGVEVTGKWQGAKGFFSGEGLVLLKASGVGDLFFNSYGGILEIDVKDEFIVDTGYVVAFEESLQYRITVLPGLRAGGKIKSFFFGGEGLVCQFAGSGRVWIQTRNVQSFLSWVNAFRPTKSN